MKKIATLLLSATLIAPPALAAGLGYVNVGRLLDQSPQSLAQIKELEAEFAGRGREIKTILEQVKAAEQDLEKNGLVMAAEELQTKTEALRDLQRKLKRAQREYKEDYTVRRNQKLAGLEKIISKAIVAVAKRKKLDLVLQQAVYADPGIDLTEQVLSELKKTHKP